MTDDDSICCSFPHCTGEIIHSCVEECSIDFPKDYCIDHYIHDDHYQVSSSTSTINNASDQQHNNNNQEKKN